MNYTLIQPIGSDAEVFGYSVQGGGQVQREYGTSPNGNPMSGRWVYRDANGTMIDFNMYRSDLFENNHLRVCP